MGLFFGARVFATTRRLRLAEATCANIHSPPPARFAPACIQVWKPRIPGVPDAPDMIFISTERYRFCLLAYDPATGEIVTKAAGDLSDRAARPCECGQVRHSPLSPSVFFLSPACRPFSLSLI